MKKLSKIRLQNAVVLEDSEMKAIYGGSGGNGGSGSAEECTLHCNDGEKFPVSSCANSTACDDHGGKDHCNGPTAASCMDV